jgi:hypothetical protein
MPGGTNIFSRVPKAVTGKPWTFNGTTTGLTSAADTVLLVTGAVWIDMFVIRGVVTPVSSSGTIAVGTAGSTGGIIAATTATLIVGGAAGTCKFWTTTTPALIVTPLVNIVTNQNIIFTYATANVTAGSVVIDVWWHPIEAGANLS